MKTTTIAALACALCAAACGSSNPPAQQPMNSTAEMNPPPATSPAPSGPTYGSTPTYGDGSATDGTSTGATSMMGPGGKGGAPAPADTTASSTTAPSTTGATDTNAAPDNTRVNRRDRQSTLTPIDQGNSKQEIAITASIRRGVMRDKSLSFTAKNVKIITQGTTVTLRGPVSSDAEKSTIENLARQTAGVTDVDDQLEVKGAK